MKNGVSHPDDCKAKIGVTLLEMLIVLAVITVLVSMVVGIAARIDNQGKERLVKNTFALLGAALGQFKDYGYQYKAEEYRDFEFPIDCNGLSKPDLESELGEVLDMPGEVSITGDHNDPNFSGSEALYFFLSEVPASREALDKIDKSLITNEGSDKRPMEIQIGERKYPLRRIIDPWGKTIHYRYYENRPYETSNEPPEDERRNFPIITSAGPDRIFGTADDITNR
jgi:hypothetical protein